MNRAKTGTERLLKMENPENPTALVMQLLSTRKS
jgi:hypothetical protein